MSNSLILSTSIDPTGIKAITDRSDTFDRLIQQEWPPRLEGRISRFGEDSRSFVTELKTRYVTNPLLTEKKTQALLSLIFALESEQRVDGPKNIDTSRLKKFLEIQVRTRSIEQAILDANARQKPTYKLLADFMRDIYTLQSLGFVAPKLEQIKRAIDSALNKNPGMLFDASILGKYREAVSK